MLYWRVKMTKTLDYYNNSAEIYNEVTFNIDFENKQTLLLKYLQPGSHILDLGCGSGRDSKVFIEKGYKVTAVDGSKELCKIASENIGQTVICQTFDQLEASNEYDGVWACASLLHLSTNELKEILLKIERALKPNGYFYASFKYGEFEGERDGRFFNDFTETSFNQLLVNFPSLIIEELEVTVDVIPGREDVKWLNAIIKKIF